jgi:hypothetical protein
VRDASLTAFLTAGLDGLCSIAHTFFAPEMWSTFKRWHVPFSVSKRAAVLSIQLSYAECDGARSCSCRSRNSASMPSAMHCDSCLVLSIGGSGCPESIRFFDPRPLALLVRPACSVGAHVYFVKLLQ